MTIVVDDRDLASPQRELDVVAGQVASVLAIGHAWQAKIAQRAGELAADGRGPGPVEIVQRGAGVSGTERGPTPNDSGGLRRAPARPGLCPAHDG